ncbi:hypothetical protein LTS02_018293, partial [Friedmanniomyces endolithicus]
DRDDGNIARGRSPPPLRWEDATLHETQEDSSEEESNHEEPNRLIPVYQPANQVTMTETEDLGVIPEIDDSDAANESTPEETEEEYSDDDAPGDNEILHFSVDGPEPIDGWSSTLHDDSKKCSQKSKGNDDYTPTSSIKL